MITTDRSPDESAVGSSKKTVSIVGAGFSGLASAFYLVRAGFDVEVFESSDRAGGLINTLHTPEGLVETAANGFLNSRLVEDLFNAVNVPLIGTKTSARRRFIFRDGLARRWPLKLSGTFQLGWFLFRYFLDRRAVRPFDGESVEMWGLRVLGREPSLYLIDTALQGIYAGDPSRLSAKLVLGRFFAPRASVDRPQLRGSVSAPEGMGQLINGLETYLRSQGVRFHFGSAPAVTKDHPWIVATNPASAATLLPWRASELSQVVLNPVTTTTAFFDRTDRATEGFGILFAPIEKRRALGVLKNNFIFENRIASGARAQFSETWIRGGALAKENPTAQSDDEINEVIVSERTEIFGLNERPVASLTTRWPLGIPHYTLELEALISELDRSENNIFLMGNYLGDLGLAKLLERASRLPERLSREGRWESK